MPTTKALKVVLTGVLWPHQHRIKLTMVTLSSLDQSPMYAKIAGRSYNNSKVPTAYLWLYDGYRLVWFDVAGNPRELAYSEEDLNKFET